MPKPKPGARPIAPPIGEPRIIRKFWMSPELHAAVTSYAWDNRTTMSQLVRDQLEEIKVNPMTKVGMTEYDSPSSKHSVSVAVEDELYLGAKDAAYPTRHSLTSLVRRRLLRILERAGRWDQRAA